MNKKTIFISVFLILSLLLSGCADDSPVVKEEDKKEEEKNEEPNTPKPYTVQIRDNNADMPQGRPFMVARGIQRTTRPGISLTFVQQRVSS